MNQSADENAENWPLPLERQFWMNGVVCLTLVLIGATGNATVVATFHFCTDGNFDTASTRKRRRRQAFYFYLMTFAIWNTGLLVANVMFNCLPALLSKYVTTRNEHLAASDKAYYEMISDICLMLGYVIGNCSMTALVWITVVVTVERFLAVSKPFSSRMTLISPRRRAKLISLALTLCAILYNLPIFFELKLAEAKRFRSNCIKNENFSACSFNDSLVQIDGYYDDDDVGDVGSDNNNGFMETTYALEMSGLRANDSYRLFYRVLGNMIFVSALPFSIIVLLTVKIVCVVRESDRRRAVFRGAGKPARQALAVEEFYSSSFDHHHQQLQSHSSINSNSGNDKSLSSSKTYSSSSRYAHLVLTTMAVKFLICYSLPVIINIVEVASPEGTYNEKGKAWKLALVIDISNLLVAVDGAINALFYFSWRKRIRLYGSKNNGSVTSSRLLHIYRPKSYYLQQQCQNQNRNNNSNNGNGYQISRPPNNNNNNNNMCDVVQLRSAVRKKSSASSRLLSVTPNDSESNGLNISNRKVVTWAASGVKCCSEQSQPASVIPSTPNGADELQESEFLLP